MCGIAGILNFDGAPVDRGVLERMTDIIAHRGPDSAGHWIDDGVGLGHRRLSIIDLSHEADQPMVSHAGSEIIVFNGEIYNYQKLARDLDENGTPCHTHSDTEVILNLYRLYGTACLGYLRGMFAFAIWDCKRERLFVARDRVGIKPLYYHLSDKAFVLASEIKAIAVSGYSDLKVDASAFAGFLRFLVVSQPETVFKDIRKLEPGHYLLISKQGNVTEGVFWEISNVSAGQSSLKEEVILASLDEVLRESVGYHMVADVPVAAFLSGGVDSSAVVSLMREHAPQKQIDAFSIIFPGQAEYDEDVYARQVADIKGVDYHADTLSQEFMVDIEQIAWHLDEPFAISSAYATYYLAKNAATRTKVVLTGDGGDELFGGYEGYKNDAYIRSSLSNNLFSAAYMISSNFTRYLGFHNRTVNQVLSGLRRRSGSEGLRYSEQMAQSSLLAANAVLNPDIFQRCLISWQNNLMARYYDDLADTDRLQRKLYAEFRTRLVDEMLMKVDRMTMAASLEARVPLLDHRVVEYAFTLPSDMKLRGKGKSAITKYVLKKAMEKYLPNDIIYRRKQGFNIPVKSWLSGGLSDSIRERVLGGHLQKWGVVDANALDKFMGEQKGSAHTNSMLMLLLAFESWAEAYQSRVGNISIA